MKDEVLFPDLAPYGKALPPVILKPKIQIKKPKPLTARQPNVTAQPLHIAATPKETKPAQQLPIEAEPQVLNTTTKLKKSRKKLYMIIAATLMTLVLGYIIVILLNKKPAAGPASISTTNLAVSTNIKIPFYYPKSLPVGYKYNNDKKTISPNVYSISVTGPNKEYFYITEQAPPINKDYTPFNIQLADPRSFDSPLGKVTTGSKKNSFIVSIDTIHNSWIIINSPNTGNQSIIQPVIDSLSL